MYQSLKACPLCGHVGSQNFIKARDYLVTHDPFHIQKCDSCNFLYTNPRPSLDEIGKFYQSSDYLSHAKSDYSPMSVLYSAARKYMINQKLKWINKLPHTGNKLLDYGCGVGTFLKYCQKKNWQVWGVEPAETARTLAVEKLGNRVHSSLSSSSDKSFDVITLWHVLEHIHEMNQTLEQLLSLLSKDGWILIAVPNSDALDAKVYKEYWAGFDLPRHLYHFVPETMKLLAKKHRLQLVKTIPLKLDAYYVCLLSEKYRKGTTWRALFQAYKSNQYAQGHRSNYSSLVYLMRK